MVQHRAAGRATRTGAPPPPPQPVQAVQPPAPAPREADIALERQRQAQAQARREEAARQRQAAERRRQEQAQRQEQARRAAEERRREEQAKARAERQEEERRAQIREEQMRRIQGMAGASGPREATGSAMRSAGPSASSAGRLAAHFQRNVVFPGGVESIAGNPAAEVRVRVSPTGTILSARLVQSSGNQAWDAAAVRAIERSARIPADADGRYVQDFPVTMRPKR